jgi:hypothetical protein
MTLDVDSKVSNQQFIQLAPGPPRERMASPTNLDIRQAHQL